MVVAEGELGTVCKLQNPLYGLNCLPTFSLVDLVTLSLPLEAEEWLLIIYSRNRPNWRFEVECCDAVMQNGKLLADDLE